MNRRERLKICSTLIILTGICLTTNQAWGKYDSGSGSVNDPYLIYTAEQMNTIGLNLEDMGKYFKLMNDIDLSGYIGTAYNIIGINGYNFTGTFDGNGHKILNFNYSNPGGNNIGLFGIVNGTIKNLGVISPNVNAGTSTYSPSSGQSIGGLAGLGTGSISGCYVEGGDISGNSKVGGLVGSFNNGTMSDCNSKCTVSGFANAGGVTGLNYGTITNCSFEGNVSGARNWFGGVVGQNIGMVTACRSAGSISGPESGTYYGSGGLVGVNQADGTIMYCYSTANASHVQFSGGLVGLNYGQINNCYATGKAYGNIYVGGLVGGNAKEVSKCYSTGSASGGSAVGGLIGASNGGTCSYSFWDTQRSGNTWSAGGTGKTTAQMQIQNTFMGAGWDFSTSVWVMWDGHEYPWLAWEKEPVVAESINVINRQRVGMTIFQYLCKLTLRNTRSQSFSNVSAELVEVPNNVTIIDRAAGCSYIEAHNSAISDDTFEIEIDRSVLINPVKMVWKIAYEVAGSGQQQIYMNTLDFAPIEETIDITGDGVMDLDDLLILTGQWLQTPVGTQSADIAPASADEIVNFLDFAVLAEHWLE